MARAAVKAKQQQQARAKAQPAKQARRGQRRGSGGGNANQDLFFMRLRRHAKWAYVVLALLFAATFVGVGVGSGSDGLSGLFSGIFSSSSGGKSIAAAQAEVKTNPAKGYRELAQAYEAKKQTTNAIAALQSYVALRKKDATAWTELGGLQLAEASKFYARYQRAQQASQLQNPGQAFQPAGPLEQAIGTSPIDQLTTQRSQAVLTQYSEQASAQYGAALQSYSTAAKLRPKDALAQYYVAEAAQATGNYALEAKSLERYLKLDPTSPNHGQIQKLIKRLTQATKTPPKK